LISLLLASQPDRRPLVSRSLSLLGFRQTTPKRNVLLALGYLLLGLLGAQVALGLL
jgi:hypothetical protein